MTSILTLMPTASRQRRALAALLVPTHGSGLPFAGGVSDAATGLPPRGAPV